MLDLRRWYPFTGKARIHAMLTRKGFKPSVSTVGRVLSRALTAGASPNGPDAGSTGRRRASPAKCSARSEFWSLYNGPLTVAAVTPELANYEFFFNY